jgi:hypothetical protein
VGVAQLGEIGNLTMWQVHGSEGVVAWFPSEFHGAREAGGCNVARSSVARPSALAVWHVVIFDADLSE